MDKLSSAPNTPIDIPDGSHEIFLDIDDTIRPDFTPLVDSGFLVENTQEGVQLSPLAVYLLKNNIKLYDHGRIVRPGSKQKNVKKKIDKLEAELHTNRMVKRPDSEYELTTIPDKSIAVRDEVLATIFYHPEVADVAKQIYSNFYNYDKTKRPPMALARDLTSAAMIGTLFGTGSAVQSGNPLLVACVSAAGIVGGLATNRLLPSTKRQLATKKNFNDPEWLETQIETFRQIASDSSIAIVSNPDMPDDPSCSLSRSANFWKDLPVPHVKVHKLLKAVAELEPLNADILWELLEKRKSAEKTYRTLNNTLNNAETCIKMGIKGSKSLEEIDKYIGITIANVDTAYRQAWIEFTAKKQRREDRLVEESQHEEMLRENEEFANDWVAVAEQLETNDTDVEKSGFMIIKEALFQGIKHVDKNSYNLKLTEDAIKFIDKAQAAHNEYITFQGIYDALYAQFGESLNLMLPEEFMRRYPSIDANVL